MVEQHDGRGMIKHKLVKLTSWNLFWRGGREKLSVGKFGWVKIRDISWEREQVWVYI